MIRYTRKDGKPSAYEFRCGAYYRTESQSGQFIVEIIMLHGLYIVRMLEGTGPWMTAQGFDTNKEAWEGFRFAKGF